ncbi:MipA/OmpV family protein [Thalassotalea fusca]
MFFHKRFLIVLLLFCLPAFASDKKAVHETTVFDETFSWQAMLGVSIFHNPQIIEGYEQDAVGDFLNISLLFDLYYKGFFIQSNHRRANSLLTGAELGYQLHVDKNWEVDIIMRTYIGEYDPEEIVKDNDFDFPLMEGLGLRGSADGLGLRYSHYFDDAVLSIDVASIAVRSDAPGWVSEIYYNKLVPYRNWDIYLGAGVVYYSQQLTDYYIGVDPHEATDARPAYEARAGFEFELELFARHPISQNWTFNTGISHAIYSSHIRNSPLVATNETTQVMLGVHYVF